MEETEILRDVHGAMVAVTRDLGDIRTAEIDLEFVRYVARKIGAVPSLTVPAAVVDSDRVSSVAAHVPVSDVEVRPHWSY